MGYANSHGYPEIEADKIEVTGDRILLVWEEKKSTLLGGKLAAPLTNRKQHYTGEVVKIGPLVDPTIQIGDRVIFDQFSNFIQFFDKKYGRLALIEESKQGDCYAVIPKRVEVDNGELGYDFEAA